MSHQPKWQDLLLPQGNEDLLWEVFHENSKIGAYQQALSDEDVRKKVSRLYECLPFEGYPIVELPRSLAPLPISLEEAVKARASARTLTPDSITLPQLATLLHSAYGVTRDTNERGFPRSFRVVPSGGALYPLELFLHSTCIEGLDSGLYHYNPIHHHLRLIRDENLTSKLAAAVIQPEIAQGASLLVFLTAFFERSVFKYGDRGYRFILMEAGHVAQNINLVSIGLGFDSVNLGGFLDRTIDELLGLDGVTQSTIYLVAIGRHNQDPR